MADILQLPGACAQPAAEAGLSPPANRKRRPSGAWRRSLAFEAACEICFTGELLQRLHRGEDQVDWTVVRALGMRLEELGGVVMACDDEADTEKDVVLRLRGRIGAQEREGRNS